MSILNTTTFRPDRQKKKKHGTADVSLENQYTVLSRGFEDDADRAAAKRKKGKGR